MVTMKTFTERGPGGDCPLTVDEEARATVSATEAPTARRTRRGRVGFVRIVDRPGESFEEARSISSPERRASWSAM
jgi:hypothetical protein